MKFVLLSDNKRYMKVTIKELLLYPFLQHKLYKFFKGLDTYRRKEKVEKSTTSHSAWCYTIPMFCENTVNNKLTRYSAWPGQCLKEFWTCLSSRSLFYAYQTYTLTDILPHPSSSAVTSRMHLIFFLFSC